MSDTPLPVAQLAPPRYLFGGWWWIPLVVLLGSAWLLLEHLGNDGTEILVTFPMGHGIKAGDALRHRGIRVGEVVHVSLGGQLDNVQVRLRLDNNTAQLARQGSRFWIVRPRLDLSGAEGLETVIGARYLAVAPGTGPPSEVFQGLADAPRIADPSALMITLQATGRGHLRVGAPVTYRQVTVGSVEQVTLAADATHVQAELAIHPAYRGLIRENTRFWRTSGARLGADLGGLFLDIDSLQSLALGGIALAVPPQPGSLANPGQRFSLAEQADPDWLDWQPSLQPAGPTPLPEFPGLVPLSRRWRDTNALGLSRSQQRQGWGLPLPGGLLAPEDLLSTAHPEIEALELRAAEHRLTLDTRQAASPELAWLHPETQSWRVWQGIVSRPLEGPEDVLVVTDAALPGAFVAAYRLQAEGSAWRLLGALPGQRHWHGAAVIATRDQQLVGILLEQANHHRVVPIPTPE